LDADYPENGVLIPCRNTLHGERTFASFHRFSGRKPTKWKMDQSIIQHLGRWKNWTRRHFEFDPPIYDPPLDKEATKVRAVCVQMRNWSHTDPRGGQFVVCKGYIN
jgi:hypothetical protein